MQPGFTILEHPSDIGIEAWGSSMPEAFEQVAGGLMAVILDPVGVRASEEIHITLESSDLEQLLVKWLSEILYLYDGRQFVPISFAIRKLSCGGLQATLKGERFSLLRHRTRMDVKAVTYHQLLVREEGDGARVRVFLDI